MSSKTNFDFDSFYPGSREKRTGSVKQVKEVFIQLSEEEEILQELGTPASSW